MTAEPALTTGVMPAESTAPVTARLPLKLTVRPLTPKPMSGVCAVKVRLR